MKASSIDKRVVHWSGVRTSSAGGDGSGATREAVMPVSGRFGCAMIDSFHEWSSIKEDGVFSVTWKRKAKKDDATNLGTN